MHPYATDSRERVGVIAALVVLSMVASEALSRIPPLPDWTAWFVDFSAPAIFAVLFGITNVWLWRFTPVRWLQFFHMPDLRGEWTGELRSSFDNYEKVHPCKLRIQQTWMNMSVMFVVDESSKSSSRAASLLLDENGETVLRYEYFNQPDELKKSTLDLHWGTARLVLGEVYGITSLDGTYYTNRALQTSGKFSFVRV